jgi:transposase
MNAIYIVSLDENERKILEGIISTGSHKARKVKRAQILLAADRACGQSDREHLTDKAIAAVIGAGTSTVFRVRRKFVEQGLQQALKEEPRGGAPRKFDGKHNAKLVAIACSDPPTGSARWTLALLAERLVALTEIESISTETVRRRLKDNNLKPWQRKMWCIPKFNAEYVARMEDLLDLYAEPPDPKRPVVSFDETPVQLIGETRVPVPAKPGRKRRIDYEYKRNGTANLFVAVDRHRGWRHVDVTDRRTKVDFARQMRDLVDVHYPDAELIRVTLDNLSTHKPAALYEAFEPQQARRILRKLEFHYTPTHASWLNMVEIEIGVLSKQCLARRIGDRQTLERHVDAWLQRRNESGATIRWMFSVEDAREKMTRAYPANHEVHGGAQ